MNAEAERVERLSQAASAKLDVQPEDKQQVESAGELGFSKSSWGSAC